MAVDNTQLKNNVLRDKLVIQEMLKNYTDTGSLNQKKL